MPITPEDRARQNIDRLLAAAGWIVKDRRDANITAGRGVAVCKFPMKTGHGEADYLLFVDGATAGAVEAKKEGKTLRKWRFRQQNTAKAFPTMSRHPGARCRSCTKALESRPVSRIFWSRTRAAARSLRSIGLRHSPNGLTTS